MTATSPLRLRILKALSDSLSQAVFEYTPEGGSPWDPVSLEDRVFRGRVVFGEDDPLPMLSILEAPIPVDQVPSPPDSPDSTGAWELLIQGFVPDDHKNPTDPAHFLMAAVKVRLAAERKRNADYDILGFGKHVTGLRIGVGVVRPPDEISGKAYFWLNIALDLVEDLSAPFED